MVGNEEMTLRYDLRLLSVLALSSFAVIGVTGCEARVALGFQCESRSDCPVDLVCVQGRCRAECSEARDCAFPLECIVEGTTNAGGCRVTEDGACRGDEDCAGDLVCEANVCVQPCTDHDECAVAQVCNGRGCVRNQMVGVCDVLSGTGCDEGERCGVSGMRRVDEVTGEVTDERVVECLTLAIGEVRDAEEDESCDANPDTLLIRPCRDGLTCVLGQCQRWCLFDETMGVVGSNCGRGSRCLPTYAGAFAPPTCGFCSEGCNPGTQDCIDETRTCAMGIFAGPEAGPDDDFAYGQCVPPAAMLDCTADPTADGCQDNPCAMGRCALGLDCVVLDAMAMTSECVQRCDVGVVDGCAGGRTCDVSTESRVLIADGTTRRLGVCR